MSRRVNLVTLIGHQITTLPHLLQHYSALGVHSFRIYVHITHGGAELLERVYAIAAGYHSVSVQPVAGDWLAAEEEVTAKSADCPDDWFLAVDQDEFHLYPDDLERVLAECERAGFDHIRGCFVDRFAEDGSLRKLDHAAALWPQYPIGAFFTSPVCRGNCEKIVAAKGRVRLTTGRHRALCGTAAPISNFFVEVHHFKWIAGVLEYLLERRPGNHVFAGLVRREGERFAAYYRSLGARIDLDEPALMAAECAAHYPHWETIRRLFLLQDFTAAQRDAEIL